MKPYDAGDPAGPGYHVERNSAHLTFWTQAGIGLVASVVMTVLMVALRFALNTPVLPELMSDRFTLVVPPAAFDFLLERLQFIAKPLLFASLLAGQVVAGTGLGLLYIRLSPRLIFDLSQPWRRGLLFAAILWLAIAVLLTPLMGAGLFGSAVPGSSTSYLAATFMAMAAYGVTLAFLHHMALTREDGSSSLDRRAFLQRAAFFGVLVVVGGFSLRAIIRGASSISTARAFRTSGKMPPEVTPNEEFYVVASGIVTPNVKVASWELYVGGGLEGPLTLSYEELQAMPWIEEYVTLTCISNVIGGDLISNALWRGVPLKALLERARLPDSTERIAFHAVDGYVDSFPMDYAMRDHTMVAYMMNGEPLSDSHGFPARIIVPGLYGMENVKWLTRIEPVPADFRGYWQVRGWADTAVIRTMSRIDIPEVRLGATLGENEVGGVAFAGDRGIDKVEISTDDQESWQSADLSRPLSPYTWVLWKTLWVPPGAGRFGIAVRATDGDGVVQTSLSQASLPSGAAGHHKISVRASGDRPVAIASPNEEPKAPDLPFLR